MEIALVLILLFIALVLFALELVPPDVTALGLLAALLAMKLLTPEQAFSGFGSDAVVMIAGLFVMTAALVKTGVVESLGRNLYHLGGSDPRRLAVWVMVSVATLSAFISNTAATAVFLPAIIGLARKAKMSPSKLLMPLAFASILTSSVTLISTSTNIVISGLLPRYGMAPMGMFELAPVGIVITVMGLLYMFLIGMKLLPQRAETNLEVEYHLRDYVTEVVIFPNSPLVGKSLSESRFGEKTDLLVLGIVENERIRPADPDRILTAGDLLLVQGRAEDIIRIKNTAGVEIKADFQLSENAFAGKQLQLIEAMVMPESGLRGRTLKETRFRDRFGLNVLAINRRGVTLRNKISSVPLRMGDVILLEGGTEEVGRLVEEGDLTVLGDVTEIQSRGPKAKYALVIFSLAIAAGTFKIVPFSVAVVFGTLMMFVFGAITPQEAYNYLEWRVLVVIGSMIAFGTAMEETGTAMWLAGKISDYAASYGPHVTLGGFFILTVALTQPMSNQA
ncbi:MAG TPA: SLC13 family permease, partial [Acidobacteriota bacterium]|nr:SLC13 family permease [Acidobacteriota bacterium]